MKPSRLRHSFPLGTVWLLEQHRLSDLPAAQERAKLIEALDQFLDDQVTPLLGTVALPGMLVGPGNTGFPFANPQGDGDLDATEFEALSWLLPRCSP